MFVSNTQKSIKQNAYFYINSDMFLYVNHWMATIIKKQNE